MPVTLSGVWWMAWPSNWLIVGHGVFAVLTGPPVPHLACRGGWTKRVVSLRTSCHSFSPSSVNENNFLLDVGSEPLLSARNSTEELARSAPSQSRSLPTSFTSCSLQNLTYWVWSYHTASAVVTEFNHPTAKIGDKKLSFPVSKTRKLSTGTKSKDGHVMVA